MVRLFASLAVALLAVPAYAGPQIADVICDTRDGMLTRLQRTHGAEKQGHGIRDASVVLEIWAIPSTGEWTLVQSYATGKSCIVAMGEGWEMMTPPDPS